MPASPGRIVQGTIERPASLSIGDDMRDVGRLYHKMKVPMLVGRRDMSTRAIVGIDAALWDVKERRAGQK